MNNLSIIGRLGNDPELTTAKSGMTIANLSVAVPDGFGDDKKTIWLDVTAFQKQAENAGKFLTKGSHIAISGKLSMDEWTDKESGKKRTKLKVIANQIDFLDPKSSERNQDTYSEPKRTAAGGVAVDKDDELDDLPF